MDKPEKIKMRKIIPVAAMVSAGKSRFLNTIYNINYLECKAGIGTKFINILRYNPKINEPHFFHLKIKKQGEKYEFYKDNLYPEVTGEAEIIEENKNVNSILASEKNVKYENIFYMTEINDSPFIKDKEYLLSHDFCDIPGLSEYQEPTPDPVEEPKDIGEDAPKPIGEEEKLNIIREKFGLLGDEKEEGKIKNVEIKEEDEIFYMGTTEVENNTYISEIFKIIKNYIDGLIIILSVENYYFESNFELITKLHKVTGKPIKNCLVILNKIDKTENPDDVIKKCKSLFLKYFPSCKTFNINLNTFIPLSTIQLQNELLSNESFKHLLSYHLYNYINKINREKLIGETPIGKSFLDHLIKIVKTEEGITRKEIEKIVGNSNKIINEKEIIDTIKELKDFSERNKINFGINEDDFKKVKKKCNLLDFNFSKINSKENSNDNIEDINPSYIVKLLYIYQKENKLLPQLSEETIDLFNYFKIKEDKQNKNQIQNIINFKEEIELNKNIINNIKCVIEKMEQSQFSGNEIKQIIKNMYSTIEYLEIYDVIFIPFLGPSNAGKSTIINDIIGEEVLPTELNECTKRGIIIRYATDGQKDINIRKAIFRQNNFLGKEKCYFEADTLITEGLKNVQDTLKGLNYEFTDKQEDSFYYIRTKIKLFDDLRIDNNLKKLIYIIDFPGYGTNNKFEQFLFNKVTSICNSFMFVIKNSLIKENHNQMALKNIFNQAKDQKNELSSGFVKNCLFILNNDDSQETSENELEKAKGDLAYLIKNVKKGDINSCFFNAKYYLNYLDNYNYFNNIQNTFKNEFNSYKKYKSDILKNPENYSSQKYNRFCDYIYVKIVEKIKEGGFETSIDSDEEINDNILSQIENVLLYLESNNSLAKDDFTQEHKNIIAQIISFAQRNLSELNSLKESNIEELKINLMKQINSINDEIQNELKNNLNEEIKILDFFFNQNFSDRKKDLTIFEQFKHEVCLVTKKFSTLPEYSFKEIKTIKNNFANLVKNSLLKKEKEIKILLKEKNWKIIQEEIKNEINDKLKSLNEEIDSLFNNINYNSNMLYQKIRKLYYEFTDKKLNIDNVQTFNDFFISRALKGKNAKVLDEIYKELEVCIEDSLTNIFHKKGLFSFFDSLFSNVSYFSNLIEILIDLFSKELEKLLLKIEKIFEQYISGIKIANLSYLSLITLMYTNNQNKEWKNLCSIYKSKRELIYQDLNKLIENKKKAN